MRTTSGTDEDVGADLLPVGTNTLVPMGSGRHGGFVRLVQQTHQGRPSAGDAGAECADRTVAYLGRFRVGQAEELGEDERLPALARQGCQQVERGDAVVEAGQILRLGPFEATCQSGTSDSRGRAALYR
ncbi:hypothetical protein HOK021_39420 [Streptomyces hygroscopicus]|nr:hypothetical protein HOK021_39420 [Streptomyces hygroscopicus]